MINPNENERISVDVKARRRIRKPVPKSFHVHQHDKDIQISYEELFEIAHKLWLEKRYEAAVKIFTVLSEVTDQGPRAHLFLAHCKAMLDDFKGCSRTLDAGLPREQYGNMAMDLHDTFCMWKCMLTQEVRKGLEKIIADYPDLPTPCLMLGDFLAQTGVPSESSKLLRQAIQRDWPGGSISRIAKQELSADSPKDGA